MCAKRTHTKPNPTFPKAFPFSIQISTDLGRGLRPRPRFGPVCAKCTHTKPNPTFSKAFPFSIQISTDLGRGLRPRPRSEKKKYSPCVRETYVWRDIYGPLQPKTTTLYNWPDFILKCGCPKGTRIGRKKHQNYCLGLSNLSSCPVTIAL